MAKVVLNLPIDVGVTMHVERELDTLFLVVGKWAVNLSDGNLSVGTLWQNGYLERPILKVPADD